MRLNRVAVTTAILATLSFGSTFTAHADTDSRIPRIAIETVCGQGNHVFNIRNVGTVTAVGLHYTLCAGASQLMPPLRTWDLRIFPLAPNGVIELSLPSSVWGFKVWVKVSADAQGAQVLAATPETAFPNFCW